MSSTKTVEERRSSPVAATGGFGNLFKFKIPEAKYGVLLTALALSLIYIDGAPPFHLILPYQCNSRPGICWGCWAYPAFFGLAAFATRLFSVLRFESVIHEFDPYGRTPPCCHCCC